MSKIAQILLRTKPFLYLLFDNEEIKVLNVNSLNCQFCLDNFHSVKIDELGGLEWDLMHSIEAEMVYKLSTPLNKNDFLNLINYLLENKPQNSKKLSKAIKALL